MRPLLDMTGQRFGRLVVLARAENTSAGQARWSCACDCGAASTQPGQALREGRVVSCGCIRNEKLAARSRTHGATRGRRRAPEYTAWANMIQRCENPAPRDDHLYGGRGIRVCPLWSSSFTVFLADVGPRPAGSFSIDRIDVNGDYQPGNVRWATPVQQQNNRRDNVVVDYHGEVLTLSMAYDRSPRAVSRAVVYSRLASGWPAEAALDRPALRTEGRRAAGSTHYGG